MLADDDIRDLLVSRLPELRPDLEAELERVLTRARSRSRRRRASYVGGLAAAVAATVIVLGHDWQSRADGPDVVDHVTVRAQPLVNRGMFRNPAPVEPGRYEARFVGMNDYPGPRIELDIPAGWGQDDVYAFATGPAQNRDTRRIDLYADVERVAPAQCGHGGDTWVRVGSSAQAFAEKLAGMGSDSATTERVTLGGYDGYQVALPGPTGAEQGGCASTVLMADSLRRLCALDLPGWSSTTWVFNVDGHLVVVSASQGPDVTSAEEQELVGIVESLSFVLP
jgi:hypothetical protein